MVAGVNLVMAEQRSFLSGTPGVPEGFAYVADFLAVAEEAGLLNEIGRLEFHEVKMRGVVAKRRVIHYGVHYSFETFKASPGPPIPAFLLPLRERAGAFGGVSGAQLEEALITHYSPGASIGWHRDAHPFDIVIGISLLSRARFRFRRGKVRAWEMTEFPLEPRSAYVLTGPARTDWEHSIPEAKELRYSITFRTLRKPVAALLQGPERE
ncbi:alpha-ketoglutarate-dependent dioxygenase AlkB [soil metagenome]